MQTVRIFFVSFLLGISFSANAAVGDLRSLSREIRYGLASHGRALTIPERKTVRFELASSIVSIEKVTGRRARAGTTLQGLATTAQRLLDTATERELSPAVQRKLERRLARCAFLLERRKPQ